MKIVDLAGKRVALWGWGREGRAAYAALRACLPGQALTLFCSVAEASEAAASNDPLLAIEHTATSERLAAFDVVVKSPGISPCVANETTRACDKSSLRTRLRVAAGPWGSDAPEDQVPHAMAELEAAVLELGQWPPSRPRRVARRGVGQ